MKACSSERPEHKIGPRQDRRSSDEAEKLPAQVKSRPEAKSKKRKGRYKILLTSISHVSEGQFIFGRRPLRSVGCKSSQPAGTPYPRQFSTQASLKLSITLVLLFIAAPLCTNLLYDVLICGFENTLPSLLQTADWTDPSPLKITAIILLLPLVLPRPSEISLDTSSHAKLQSVQSCIAEVRLDRLRRAVSSCAGWPPILGLNHRQNLAAHAHIKTSNCAQDQHPQLCLTSAVLSVLLAYDLK